MRKENREMDEEKNEMLTRPVGLPQAEKLLREYYPEYAFSRHALRWMAINRTIPFIEFPRGGVVRKVSYFVRVGELVAHFRKAEVKA